MFFVPVQQKACDESYLVVNPYINDRQINHGIYIESQSYELWNSCSHICEYYLDQENKNVVHFYMNLGPYNSSCCKIIYNIYFVNNVYCVDLNLNDDASTILLQNITLDIFFFFVN